MKWLAKKMFTLLAIVFIIVSIYFIITIVGNRHEIIEAYNRITYTKQEGADNMRANFLQVYSTYGEDLLIELDEFAEPFAPLMLAEIEFPNEGSALAFRMPDWFSEDVTSDPAYHNSNMSRKVF